MIQSKSPKELSNGLIPLAFWAALLVFLAMMIILRGENSGMSHTQVIFSSAFMLTMLCGKLHDAAEDWSLREWVTKPLAYLTRSGMFVALYPFIKYVMSKVFGI